MRRPKRAVLKHKAPTGPCDLCPSPWVFVTFGNGKKSPPTKLRCCWHRNAP